MKFSLASTMNMSWPEVVEVAQTAEALGFDDFFTSDHLKTVAGFDDEKGLLDAVPLLAALAGVTKRIRLGSLVSPVSIREPLLLMRQLHTVDILSNGRAVIGLGAGWDAGEHAVFGLPFGTIGERLAKMDAGCASIRARWPELRPRSPQAEPRILVAGASKSTIATAARYADVLVIQGSPGYARETLPKLRAAEKDVGRKLKRPVEAALRVMTIFPEDATMQAWHKQRASAQQAGTQGRAQAAATLPGEDPGARNYVGPREGLPERIAEYASAGVERMIFVTPRPFGRASLEKLARTAGM